MSKKESYWFSHDSNAANNPKMVALKRKYGYEGYGRWWRLVERLRESADYRYDISVPFAWEVIGQDLDMSAADAEAFVRECIDYYKLLETDGQYFWSSDLDDRMEYWEKRREVLRERGRKGGKARKKKDTNDDSKQDASTSKQDVSTGLSTSIVNLKPKEANETKRNQTKLNETTLLYIEEDEYDDDDAGEEGEEEKQEDVMEQHTNVFSALRDKALADDQRFVYAYVSTGKVNKEQLAQWLTAFNRWLEFTGEQVKEERDYRRHFAAWFRYRDVVKEDPAQYNPATIHSAKQEQTPASKTVPLPASIPPDKPKGKFSKGSNRYDMHWLKNLRDEVRSMGG